MSFRVFDAMDTCAAQSSSGTLSGTYLVDDCETPATNAAVASEKVIGGNDDDGSRSSRSGSDEWENDISGENQTSDLVHTSPRYTPSHAITLQGVHFFYKSRPDREVFKGINLKIDDRSLTVIVGKNGCGKSTLHGLLCGLYPPTSGKVLIGDHSSNVEDELEWARSKVSAWAGGVRCVLDVSMKLSIGIYLLLENS